MFSLKYENHASLDCRVSVALANAEQTRAVPVLQQHPVPCPLPARPQPRAALQLLPSSSPRETPPWGTRHLHPTLLTRRIKEPEDTKSRWLPSLCFPSSRNRDPGPATSAAGRSEAGFHLVPRRWILLPDARREAGAEAGTQQLPCSRQFPTARPQGLPALPVGTVGLF